VREAVERSAGRVEDAGSPRVLEDRDIRAFAIGSCYARTPSYPNGVCWVALRFYRSAIQLKPLLLFVRPPV